MPSGSDLSAFVPGFQYDIFVSYAQVDDLPYFEGEPGWVTRLVRNLSNELARKLGGREGEVFKIWMDRRERAGLAGNKPIREEIQGALDVTAILVIVLSTAYLKREWCQFELEAFAEAMERVRLTNGRIFIVERDYIDPSERPQQLQNLRGYRFWIDNNGEGYRTLGVPKPTPQEPEYFGEISRISAEIVKELNEIKALKESAQQAVVSATPADDRPTVFLAEATDDLYYTRKQVVEYLDQAGLSVVPSAMEHYPFSPDEFRVAVERDIAACDTICVQLLSGVPSRYQDYVQTQCDLAAASGRKLLQWRSRDVDLSRIDDKQLARDLLDSETVLAVGIEEFKKTVVDRARSVAKARERAQTAASADFATSNAFIRLSATADDSELRQQIEELLDRHHISYDAGQIDNLDDELEYVFETCDGLIIPYSKGDVRDVEKRLRAFVTRKFRHSRQPLLAVYQQIPPEKPAPGIRMPGLRFVRGEAAVHEQELLEFIGDLQQNADDAKAAAV